MHNKIPLGTTTEITAELNETNMDMTIEERLESIEDTIENLKNALSFVYEKIHSTQNAYQSPEEIQPEPAENLNKDGIVINTTFIGVSKNTPYVLCVHKNYYSVGNKQYNTLSAAAEGVSGVRRSGWEFWKEDIDGRSVKELYNKNWKVSNYGKKVS